MNDDCKLNVSLIGQIVSICKNQANLFNPQSWLVYQQNFNIQFN